MGPCAVPIMSIDLSIDAERFALSFDGNWHQGWSWCLLENEGYIFREFCSNGSSGQALTDPEFAGQTGAEHVIAGAQYLFSVFDAERVFE